MNIFTAPYLRVKTTMHPLTRSGRKPHAFAEGLDKPRPTILIIKGTRYEATPFQGDEGTAVVRLVKQAGKGEVYDVSRGPDGLVKCDCPSYVKTYEGTSATCKHGTAVVEAGLLDAPAPVPNRAPVNRIGHLVPSVAKVETADEGETIPADVRRIRVTSGSAAGVWHRQPKRNRWIHEDDASSLDFSDTARWLAVEVANAWYVAGRVAILVDAPTAKPVEAPAARVVPTAARVVPTPFDPSLDEIWHGAFTLGRAGVNADPCSTWSDAAKLAWLDGFYWGLEQRGVDHEEDADARTESALAS